LRIFIALLFPKLIKDEIYSTLEILKDNYRGNYTSYDNLHLTLHYIGEVNIEMLKKVTDSIMQIACPKFHIKTANLSSFKNSSKHRLVHVKVLMNSQLDLLHKRVIFALEMAGVTIDNANFSPHITLGRKIEIDYDELNSYKIRELDIPIAGVSIMESKRVDEELVYEEIAFKKFE
jgi:2'-5' RNA ligase